MSTFVAPTILIGEDEECGEPAENVRKNPFKNGKATVWLKTGVKSLARKCRIVDDNDDGKANLVQTIFNITNANTGTGILAMPFVIRLGGYWGLGLIILIGIMGNYTGKILVGLLYEENQDGTRIRVRDSYADIGEDFDSRFGRYMVHWVNCFEQTTHCVLLLIMPGTLIANTFPSTNLDESAWIGILSLFIIPSIFLRKMLQVTWTSVVSVSVAIVISLTVLAYSFTHRMQLSDEIMPDFDFHITPISIGIVMVSYSSQAYLPAIERCMRDPELFNSLMDFSYTVVTGFKFAIGIAVYIAFSDKTHQVMTLNLPHNAVGYLMNIGAVVLALAFYPVPMFAVFDIIENQITLPASLQSILDTGEEEEEDEEGKEGAVEAEGEIRGGTGMSVRIWNANTLYRFIVVMLFITVGVAVPHFSLLMSFIGSTTGITLVLIYPCLFNLKINWLKLSNLSKTLNFLVIGFSVVAMVLGVHSAARAFYTVYNEKF